MIGPDCCKRFVNVFANEIGAIVAPALFVRDFLYGEAFCGRIATAGTAQNLIDFKYICISFESVLRFTHYYVCLDLRSTALY